MDRRFQFEIPVGRCLGGYTWLDARVDGGSKPMQVLAARFEPGEKLAPAEVYFPLRQESALFRILAGVELNPDAIRKFADKYGQIYEHQFRIEYWRDGLERQSTGTPMYIWRQTILALRHWTTVWNFISAKNERGLLRYMKELEFDQQDLTSKVVNKFIANSWPILNSPPKDRIRTAKKCLCLGVWESELLENFTVHLRYDENRDTFGFRLRGEDLVVAIWAQFAMAVIDSKEYECCKTCGKPFEVSPEVARTNREYCSTPCRLKAYRNRQRNAVRLKGRGKSLKEIADQLGSDVTTVRGWIKKAQEK